MADIHYTCNLLPLHIVSRAGHTARWLGNHLQVAGTSIRRHTLDVHPMTCPYVTRLIPAAEDLFATAPPEDGLVVPAGCDAMRRLGDLLAFTYPGRVCVVAVPRSSNDGALSILAGELARLDDWLRARPRTAPSDGRHGEDRPLIEYVPSRQPGGVFIVAGPLSDDSLLRFIRRLGTDIAGFESCTSPDRWKPLATPGPTDHDGWDDSGDSYDPEAYYVHLAATMQRVGMCPRRSTADRRRYLAHRLDETRPSTLIYARQSFCDPGAYDAVEVAQLAEERSLPFLEIEVGFPFDASGPLRTRIEAFLEAQALDDDLLDDPLDDVDDNGPDEILHDRFCDDLDRPDDGAPIGTGG